MSLNLNCMILIFNCQIICSCYYYYCCYCCYYSVVVIVYSFYTRNGMGFEAFFTRNMNLVVATSTKKQFHSFTIQQPTFRSSDWVSGMQLAIVILIMVIVIIIMVIDILIMVIVIIIMVIVIIIMVIVILIMVIVIIIMVIVILIMVMLKLSYLILYSIKLQLSIIWEEDGARMRSLCILMANTLVLPILNHHLMLVETIVISFCIFL